jgi:hypothetical protein
MLVVPSILVRPEMARPDVRFGSLADMCGATSDVRFTPDSSLKSRHEPRIISAIPPKADMCGAKPNVC